MTNDLDAIRVARQARAGWLSMADHHGYSAAYNDVYGVLLAWNISPNLATAKQWLAAVQATYSAIEQRLAASIDEAEYA